MRLCFYMVSVAVASFTLSWGSIPEDVDGYRVYRREGLGGAAVVIYEGLDTLAVDSTVAVGHRYFYNVRAFRGDLEGEESNTVSGAWVDFARGRPSSVLDVWRGSELTRAVVPALPGATSFYLGFEGERVSFDCEVDYNGDGRLNLSDFSFFGEDAFADSTFAANFAEYYGDSVSYNEGVSR